MVVAVSALVAFGTLSACAGSQTPEASAASPFPQSARYMADMTAADGRTMTIGISVDGAEVAAYSCNGTDDEAWFFGTQTDGAIGLTSRFRDTLDAEFDGTDVTGDVVMNGTEYTFTAASVTGNAGMYTAESDGVRASWVVRPDRSAVGVQFSGFADEDGKIDVSDLDGLSDSEVRDDVRNKRKLSPAGAIEFPPGTNRRATINGVRVTPTLVTGTFRLP
ncbi:hypothetical protein [Mycobacterium sp. 236(2023)]|uniref:hypothetical protein n=1 Tax=Mycobacterium sp. 236(2023) TaxID=3038163 RepID=UPI002414E5A9|nr:hypothetical protein [Mycobacterium sp. 236(2023)]MDG4666607.1 hypothetical protein [Mycobacterium sp. 236(2023)]